MHDLMILLLDTTVIRYVQPATTDWEGNKGKETLVVTNNKGKS